MSNPSPHHETAMRLQDALSQVRQVRELCQAPSVSFGVVHRSKVVFRDSVGYRDAEQTLPADADTFYMLGSCSKMFTSAAVAILVSEGKLQWQDPIKKYLPKFCPENDARIGQSVDIIDLLRHSAGVTAPTAICLGPQRSILIDAEDLIPLLNIMPTTNEEGQQKFNRQWEYNNFTYGLAAKVVESVAGQPFVDFVRQRILQPLQMKRTALARSDIAVDDNLAPPCVGLDNGAFVQLPSESWPCENNSPLLAAMGMRSSINDMLNWCMAVLSAERTETHNREGSPSPTPDTPYGRNNPLKQMKRVRRGYWTQPADDTSTSQDAAYCMGWIRMNLPSSMLGVMSGNRFSRDRHHRMHLRHILGTESSPIQTIGHSGSMFGSVATVWTFPDTQSAVVVMANGRNFGDASDFTAQILIQALFDMTPRIDIIPWVKMEVDLARRFFDEKLLQPWKENRQLTGSRRDHQIYIGEYQGFRGLFTFSVVSDPSAASDGQLALEFNHCNASRRQLVYFQKDVYTFFPEDRDTYLTDSIALTDYRQSLLEFEFDSTTDKVTGLWWLWDPDEKREFLRQTNSPR